MNAPQQLRNWAPGPLRPLCGPRLQNTDLPRFPEHHASRHRLANAARVHWFLRRSPEFGPRGGDPELFQGSRVEFGGIGGVGGDLRNQNIEGTCGAGGNASSAEEADASCSTGGLRAPRTGSGIRPCGFGLVVLVLVLFAANLSAARAAAGDPLRYAIEATFLYKFAPFVTWPNAASANDGDTFHLCVVGEDRVSALLPSAIRGRTVSGRPIVFEHLHLRAPLDHCAIVYLAASEPRAAARILAALRGKPVLTVAEADQSWPSHAIVTFRIVDGHVRFDIDNTLAARSGLAISSKLLSLAHAIVRPPEDPR